MKVCPVCGTVFQGSETFCPHDGARLFTTTNDVGTWKGKTLDQVVELDHLLFVDELGERYLGKLVGREERVKVTLFNMVATPDSAQFQNLKMTQALIETPLPKQLAQVISVNAQHDPPYIIEHAPAGPTLRQLLNERDHLDWDTAIKITNYTGRVIEWLSELGIVHRALHPHAIHITDIQSGEVCISEWAHGALYYHNNSLEAAKEGQMVPYAQYMSPEQTDDASRADSRSMIYSAGMLLHEMLAGVPPYFGQESEDILKRHRRERPAKISISSQDKSLGTQLDELFELISNRTPDERFQTPVAMINALSTLLDDVTFPTLKRDGDIITLAQTPEVDDASSSTLLFVDATELQKTKNARQVEADAITKAATERSEEQTTAPAPARKKKKKRRRSRPATEENTTSTEATTSGVVGETSTNDAEAEAKKESTNAKVDDASAPTVQMDERVLEEDRRDPGVVVVDDPEVNKETAEQKGSSKIIVSEEANEPSKERSGISGSSETTEEVDDASSETLMVTPDTSKPRKKKRRRKRATRKPEATATADSSDVESTPKDDTTKDKAESPAEESKEAADAKASAEVEDSKTEETKAPESKDSQVKEDTKADTSADTKAEDEPATEAKSATATDTEDKTTKPSSAEAPRKKRRRKKPVTKKTPAVKPPETDEPAAPAKSEDKSKDDKATEETPAASKPAVKPPVTVEDNAPASDSKEDIENWFGTSTEQAWDQTYLEEHSQRTEKKYNTILTGVLVAFMVIVIAAIVYFQFFAEIQKDDEEAHLRNNGSGVQLVIQTPQAHTRRG